MNARRLALLGATLAALLLLAPAGASASFGVSQFGVRFSEADGSTATQAGSHPFAMTTTVDLNTVEEEGHVFPDEAAKDIVVATPKGFTGDVTALGRCTGAQFIDIDKGTDLPHCADSAAVGYISVELGSNEGNASGTYPVYNLVPAPGEVNKLGFIGPVANPIVIDVRLSHSPPYEPVATAANLTQQVNVFASKLTLWGYPGDPAHDPYRGSCLSTFATKAFGEVVSNGECHASASAKPFLTLPRSCTGPLLTRYEADSWQHPGAFVSGAYAGEALGGCERLGFSPTIAARPSSRAAESSTGLDFDIDVEDEGLANPSGVADADISGVRVVLPEGMTANPSAAEGLGVCTEADLARETVDSAPGAGCPDASKLGSVEVQTPLVDETLSGGLYLAEPYRNPFGTLIALYVVVKSPQLGVIVKEPIKVEPDPVTGQLVSTTEDMIQVPVSRIRVHFREGARSPLVTPPTCGTKQVKATLTPTAGAPIETSSAFAIDNGPGGAPCPAGATPPFGAGFEAGSVDNQAAAYSPFYMRLTRNDGDQDLTKFSAKLPPGVVGRLAGTAQCPDSAIAQARSRTGPHGGEEEKNAPSCPADSRIGRVVAGAGVGPVLTYVPGSLYLAGPYNGAPLSVVAIVPALAGPFDAGTVVTQEALRIDPRTAEVQADGSSSDPIPHILKGIPLKVRDIRVYVEKPEFTLNPTSCEQSATEATIFSGGANPFSTLDDTPHELSSPFRAANCAALGFGPRLNLRLKGGTRRGAHPALRGTYTPRKGDANLKKLVLRLPHSAFLDQAHIRTICTRVQFAAGPGHGRSCPKGAIYGHAKAWTPLLSEPLQGPVILRSSNHNLPDFVASLHGIIDVEAVARIDSKNGGIRATFTRVPDAPLSRVIVDMRGAKKGLIVNSTDLCRSKHRADGRYFAHSGRRAAGKPLVRPASCHKAKRKRHRAHRRAAR